MVASAFMAIGTAKFCHCSACFNQRSEGLSEGFAYISRSAGHDSVSPLPLAPEDEGKHTDGLISIR